MPVTQWHYPRFTQEREVNGAQWTNRSTIQSEDYSAVASVPLAADLTTELLGQDFGFSIPADATVTGIEVEVARKVSGGGAEKSQSIVGIVSFKGVVRADDWYNFNVVQPTTTNAGRVKYGNGVFIAVFSGTPMTILRSTDNGATWAIISHTSSATNARALAYSNGVWMMTLDVDVSEIDTALRSTDNGLTWSSVTLGFGVLDNHVKQGLAGNGTGVWIAVSRKVSRSTDNGATWTLTSEAMPAACSGVLWTGAKFVIATFGDAVANSTDGSTLTTRNYGATVTSNALALPVLLENKVVCIDITNGNIFYSVDHGDTWSVAASPALPAPYTGAPGYSVYYDELNDVYRWLATLSDWWYVALESDDFPPTAFRVTEYGAADNNWQENEVARAPAVANKYGLSFEATHLLAPVPVSGGIFDEGYAVPGGPFAYDAAELFEGRTDASLVAWDVGNFGGDGFRGADASVAAGMKTWTSAEINDPAFGVGYFARGQQGTLEVAFVRVRIHMGTSFWEAFRRCQEI